MIADLFFPFQVDICISVRMDHKSKNSSDRFYYICGNMVFPHLEAKITDFVKKAYHDYFVVKLGDRGKPFAPLVCYKTCVENLSAGGMVKGRVCNLPF